MAEISTARRRGPTWGIRAAATARVAGKMARRSRLLQATAAAARSTLSSFGRVLRLLWLEVTGLLFLSFAFIGGTYAWNDFHRHHLVSGRLIAGVCFSVLFGWFGVTSFWRVRRRS